jgi:zinc D-Ala-D-Ala carboxypeptidase
MLPLGSTRLYEKNQRLRTILLVCAVFLLGALILSANRRPTAMETSSGQVDAPVPVSVAAVIKLPDSIKKGIPQGYTMVSAAPSETELWAGKLLLIDKEHPVPKQAPAPNTLSIAAEGGGEIAVRTIKHNTAPEVILALKEMFLMAKNAGINSWLVWEGTRSYGQQLELQMERMKQYAQTMPLSKAAERAAAEVPAPGLSEHQLPYVVDIRLADGWNAVPDARPLNASPAGRLLLENAWQYGFIYRYGMKNAPPVEDEAYHFRYVGLIHSTMMHFMNLDFEQYLLYLRETGAITYSENGAPRYAVLCKPYDGNAVFSVPQGCAWEASMDNTGYAILAVIFPSEDNAMARK